jgi:hypothetical protein
MIVHTKIHGARVYRRTMPDVTKPSLTQFIDDAMRQRRTDAARIQRDTGLDANWTRQFKAGRMKSRPDPDRVHTLAGALGVDEAELWQYLDRYDMVSALRSQPASPQPDEAPTLAAALMALTTELAKWRDERVAMQRRIVALEARLGLDSDADSELAAWGQAQAGTPSQRPIGHPAR